MKIKICGIKSIKEAQIMNDTMPDFVGFVFAKSKRQTDFKTAEEIKKILNPKIKTIGVFVDTKIDEIKKISESKITDMVQLHGDYSEEAVIELKKANIKTIKVIRVKNKNYEIETNADFLLFDTYSAKAPGGLNQTFDWNTKIKTETPYFIAGGLCETNIKEAIQKLKPWGVDISSGVEENGEKTKKKVSDIIKIIRGIKI